MFSFLVEARQDLLPEAAEHCGKYVQISIWGLQVSF